MTAYTSSQSGLASAASTWGGAGHPSVNGDTFSIGGAHVVDWDLDLTGLTTGLGACSNAGTLQAHRAAGTWGAKRNGIWSGAGLIDASDGAGGSYAGGQNFVLLDNASFTHTMSGSHNIICLEPVHKYARLTAPASVGASVLSIDTDLTGEPTYWKNGDIVRLCNINGAVQSEQYVVSSVTSTTLTITATVSVAKLTGAYLVLITRNVRATGTGIGAGTAFSAPSQTSIIKMLLLSWLVGISGSGIVQLGGVLSVCGTAYGGTRANPTVTAVFCANTAGTNNCNGGTYTSAALFVGNTTGMLSPVGFSALCDYVGHTNAISTGLGGTIIGSRFIGNGSMAITSSGLTFLGVVTSGGTNDFSSCEFCRGLNCTFGAGNQFNAAILSSRAVNGYVESVDNGQTVGGYKAFPGGGTITDVASPVYDASRPRSYKHALGSATFYTFMSRQTVVPAGGSIYVRCYMQVDTVFAYLPRLWVFTSDREPILSGSPQVEVIYPNDGTTNVWKILEGTYANTTTEDQFVTVRTIGLNASGNFYTDPIIRVSSFAYPLGAAV
jgi:hypothetical protein